MAGLPSKERLNIEVLFHPIKELHGQRTRGEAYSELHDKRPARLAESLQRFPHVEDLASRPGSDLLPTSAATSELLER